MFQYPNDHRTGVATPNATAQWARVEAKSDAMVDELLAGAETERQRNNVASRRWQLAAIATLGVTALIAAAAIVLFAVPPPDAHDAGGHVAAGDAPNSNGDDAPRFWGPFRP